MPRQLDAPPGIRALFGTRGELLGPWMAGGFRRHSPSSYQRLRAPLPEIPASVFRRNGYNRSKSRGAGPCLLPPLIPNSEQGHRMAFLPVRIHAEEEKPNV